MARKENDTISRVRLFCAVFIIVAVALSIGGCTRNPEGTPFWLNVHREFEQGDHISALDYLGDLLRQDTVYTERAIALKVTIIGALLRTGLDFEDACTEGINKVPDWEKQPYRGCIDRFRWQARTRTLSLLEALTVFEAATADSDTIALDFQLRTASSAPSSIIGRIRAGITPDEKLLEPAVIRTVDRGIVIQAAAQTGSQDFESTVALFEAGSVKVSKGQFLLGVANTLIEGARVFEADRLDDEPKRLAILKRAKECAKTAVEADPKLKAAATKLPR